MRGLSDTPDLDAVAHRLDELAGRVARLTISARDPEAFFEERSEIADELRRLQRVLPGSTALRGRSARLLTR